MDGRHLLAAALLTGCAGAQPTPRAPDAELVTAIQGARIFDGQSVIAQGNVVFRGETIVAVGPEAAIPPGARVIDGRGKTVMPGLIDAHFHTMETGSLAVAQQFGVTTVIDLNAPPEIIVPLRRAQGSQGSFDQADVRTAIQLIDAPAGMHTTFLTHEHFPHAESADGCRDIVNRLIDEGADFIKIALDDSKIFTGGGAGTLSPEVLMGCTGAAHARRKLALVHVTSVALARRAVEAGADGLVHVFSDAVADPALVQAIRSRGIFVTPTLTLFSALAHEQHNEGLAADPAFAPELLPWDQSSLLDGWPRFLAKGYTLDAGRTNVRALHAAGVPLLAGTDSPNTGTAPGVSLHGELQELVTAGLSPTEALQAATSAPAARFHLDDRGRLAPGLRADLVVVEGDPTADVTATRHIVSIYKRGRAFDRQPLQARARAEQAIMGAYRKKEFGAAADEASRFLAAHEDDAEFTYQLACLQALGHQPGAVATLRKAVARDARYARRAAGDDDLAALRGDPAFVQLVGPAGGTAHP